MVRKKHKISSKRLARIISNKECRSAQDYLVELYDRLSPESRQDIKDMLNYNKRLTN